MLYLVELGRMILTGGRDGLIAITSRTTGMTARVINDQQGAPVTGIDVQYAPVNEPVNLFIYLLA